MTETPKNESTKKSIMESITENLSTLIVVLFAVFGAFLNFVGICIQQSNLNNVRNSFSFSTVAASNLMDTQWFHIFYYIAVLIAFCALAMHSSFDQHRMTLMAFLAIGFVYLTSDMHLYIVSARAESGLSSVKNYTAGGPAASFAGCFFMVLAWFYMMIFTGGMPSMPSFSK
jgi:hypothetical protein